MMQGMSWAVGSGFEMNYEMVIFLELLIRGQKLLQEHRVLRKYTRISYSINKTAITARCPNPIKYSFYNYPEVY